MTDTPDTETETDLRLYEICVLYPSNLNQKEESTLIKEVEGLFEENGGIQVAKDVWGKRGLAYSIKGNDEGNYIVYYYNLPPESLKEIDTSLRIMPNLMRHLIVKPPKDYEIVKYSEVYETWLKERESIEETRKKEKEERLAKRVADKAKRQVKRAEKTKKDEPSAPKETDTEKLSAELDKIIADDDLDL